MEKLMLWLSFSIIFTGKDVLLLLRMLVECNYNLLILFLLQHLEFLKLNGWTLGCTSECTLMLSATNSYLLLKVNGGNSLFAIFIWRSHYGTRKKFEFCLCKANIIVGHVFFICCLSRKTGQLLLDVLCGPL